MVRLTLSKLCKWLDKPTIQLQMNDSEEVAALKKRIEHLESEYNKVMALYSQECFVNISLEDILREYNIPNPHHRKK